MKGIKRETKQVRLERSLLKKLKKDAMEKETTMSELLGKVVKEYYERK